MVGIRSFPFGTGSIFRCKLLLVSGRVAGIPGCSIPKFLGEAGGRERQGFDSARQGIGV